jgi:glycosyltransferase involved in cell wall biosynthesis
MKIVAILMIRNEERVIQRCLNSVKDTVDAFSIIDTGSTDSTIELCETFLETHIGQLSKHEWKNFGHNRTRSFESTRDYVRNILKWELSETYGLLIDADMVLSNTSLRDIHLKSPGYSMYHINGNLQYTLPTLLSLAYDWKSVGVTHEYWTGGTTSLLDQTVCYINEIADGISHVDNNKFIRDKQLLEDGLKQDPDNVRYIFYLARTYDALNMYTEAIDMFERRIKLHGWDEEIWYSYYSIGLIYKNLSVDIPFEEYMLKAFSLNPRRAEPIFHLAHYFGHKQQLYKAQYYCDIGKTIPPNKVDILFIESQLYGPVFDIIESELIYPSASQEVSLPVYVSEPLPTLPETTEDESQANLYLSEPSDSDVSVEPRIQTSSDAHLPL